MTQGVKWLPVDNLWNQSGLLGLRRHVRCCAVSLFRTSRRSWKRNVDGGAAEAEATIGASRTPRSGMMKVGRPVVAPHAFVIFGRERRRRRSCRSSSTSSYGATRTRNPPSTPYPSLELKRTRSLTFFLCSLSAFCRPKSRSSSHRARMRDTQQKPSCFDRREQLCVKTERRRRDPISRRRTLHHHR